MGLSEGIPYLKFNPVSSPMLAKTYTEALEICVEPSDLEVSVGALRHSAGAHHVTKLAASEEPLTMKLLPGPYPSGRAENNMSRGGHLSQNESSQNNPKHT